MQLNKLIKKYGTPNILIDNHNNSKSGLAIWGFEEKIIFDKNGVRKNDIPTNTNPLQLLDDTFNNWRKKTNDIAAIGFVSYNIKEVLYPHIQFRNHNDKTPYYWFIKPKKTISYNLNSFTNIDINSMLKIEKDILKIDEYKNKIHVIKKELKKGNVYQINLTMEKLYKFTQDPFLLYLMIRIIAKPKFGYYINMGDFIILSFSPEQFFYVKDRIIKSYPMKGTRPRNRNNKIDENLKIELSNSIKDKAEHLMIVDLIRNDIGKITKYGSVEVNNLFQVNSYETVHQMESCVSGILKDSVKYSDIIKALCPGGSITGAPKESAMKIIDELENYNRGLYTGTIGYIKNNGDMNFNVAIRTMQIKNNIAKYPVGGGIVWDSIPIQEWEEAQLKSKILNSIVTSNG